MKILVTNVIFVLAFGSLSDNVINSCLSAGFGLGEERKCRKMFIFFFLL